MTFEEWWSEHGLGPEDAQRAAWEAATKAEREACAEVADFSGHWIGEWEQKYGSMSVAEAIRARSNHPMPP